MKKTSARGQTDILLEHFSFFVSLEVSVPLRTCFSRATVSAWKRSGRGGRRSAAPPLTRAPFYKKQQHPRKVWHQGCAGKHFQGQLKFTIARWRAGSSSPPFFGPPRAALFCLWGKTFEGEGQSRRLIMKERESHGRSLEWETHKKWKEELELS